MKAMGFPRGAAAPFSAPESVSDRKFLRHTPASSDGQLALDLVRARRDDGIERAAKHAGQQWLTLARGYVLEFLSHRRRGDDFLAEHLRAFSEIRGLESPPDGRAWGAVLRAAAREGLIAKIGYGPAKSSNLSPKVLWRVA